MSEWDRLSQELHDCIAYEKCKRSPLAIWYEVRVVGDALQENVQFLQKSVEMLGAVRVDWLNKYNEMTVSFGQLQKANRDLAQIIFDRTEQLEKHKDRVKYLESLTDGNGEMLKAKLVEVQNLEKKLETIHEWYLANRDSYYDAVCWDELREMLDDE